MRSFDELKALRDKLKGSVEIRMNNDSKTRIVVGMSTCGIAAGARAVVSAITGEMEKKSVSNVTVGLTACAGTCKNEPFVEVIVPGKEKVTYINMTPERAVEVVNSHIINGSVVSGYTIGG